MAKTHYMNPAYGKHVGQYGDDAEHLNEAGKMPHIHIATGHDESGQPTHHVVHVLHHDGTHEHHEHELGDIDGMMKHVEHHLNPNRAGGVHAGSEESTAGSSEEEQWSHGE